MTQNNVQLQNGNGPLAGLRNQLINGNFKESQRGAPVAGVDQVYQFDRWYQPGSTDGVTKGNTGGPDGFPYFAIFASGTAARVAQYVELARTGNPCQFVAGTTWTFSFYAKCASGTEAMTVQTWWSNGTSDTSADTNIVQQPSQNINTNWARYSWTFTLTATAPAATSKAFVAQVRSMTTSVSSEVQVTGCQLEPGPIATPFEQRPIGLELSLCQRYYQYASHVQMAQNANGGTGATQVNGTWNYATQMRTAPTITVGNTVNVGGFAIGVVEADSTRFGGTGISAGNADIREVEADAEF